MSKGASDDHGRAEHGGLVGTLIGLGIPEEEARQYHSEFEAGRTIVTVQAGDRYQEAVAVLRRPRQRQSVGLIPPHCTGRRYDLSL